MDIVSSRSCQQFIKSSEDIKAICKPLEKLGITFCTYIRIDENGKKIYLSNNGSWVEHYYQHKLYTSSLFEMNPGQYQSGYLLWPSESNLAVFKHGVEYFNTANGITFIDKRNGMTEFYLFSGKASNIWLNTFYINNVDVLKRFIAYFKEKSLRCIVELERNNMFVVNPDIIKAHNIEKYFIPASIKQSLCDFEQEFNGAALKNIKNEFYSLAKREKECLYYLTKGKSAKQTAAILSLSPRTIETYLDNIRRKTNSVNKLDLLSKMDAYKDLLFID